MFKSHLCSFDFLLFYEYVIFMSVLFFVQYIAFESFFCLFSISPQTVFVGDILFSRCPSVRLSVRDVLVFPQLILKRQ